MLIASVEKQLKERVQVLTDEASELVAMLGAVVKTARSNPGRGRQIET
jgi:hypothetical protein